MYITAYGENFYEVIYKKKKKWNLKSRGLQFLKERFYHWTIFWK